jgi:hypothetical protein
MDIGQAKAAAVMKIGQPFVIHAEQVKDRGMKVVNAYAVLRCFPADLVCFAEVNAALDAAASHPN